MLKTISPLISPDLLKILSEMGHGDTIVLADANYPAASAPCDYMARADGIGIPDLLEAILPLFPIDTFVEKPVTLMAAAAGDSEPVVWASYREILARYDTGPERIAHVDRFPFYDEANKAYCVVATGKRALYANIIIKKGIIPV